MGFGVLICKLSNDISTGIIWNEKALIYVPNKDRVVNQVSEWQVFHKVCLENYWYAHARQCIIEAVSDFEVRMRYQRVPGLFKTLLAGGE